MTTQYAAAPLVRATADIELSFLGSIATKTDTITSDIELLIVSDAVILGDIKSIRTGVNMSQATFAKSFHLSLNTIKGWEQGKRKPDAAATNFLRMIEADPEHVKKALVA